MFDINSPYHLRAEVVEGAIHYFISFQDGGAIHRDVEVTQEVYDEFSRFKKRERNLRRSDERHIEQSEQTEETQYSRVFNPQISIEDAVADAILTEQLQAAIQQLPDIQRRRFVMYYIQGCTYERIAEFERCTFQAVAKSIKAAEATLKKYFEIQG